MPKQPYSHPFLDYDALTRLLLSRGMRGDYNTIKECLENVGYQRLQAYWGTNAQGQIRTDFDSIWTICHYLLKQVASRSQWKPRFLDTIREPRFINIPHAWMGFPENWQNHPLWK